MKLSTILTAFASMGLAAAHIGSLTRYDPSLARGSCGWQNHPNEMVVALSNDTMGNGVDGIKNPKCGRLIEIANLQTGKRVKVAIVDTCTTCNAGSIAVTEAVSQAITPDNDGSAFSIRWSSTGLLTIGKRDEIYPPGWSPYPLPPGEEEKQQREEEASKEEAHPARDLTHYPPTIMEPKNPGRLPIPPTRMHARQLATVISTAVPISEQPPKQRRQWVFPDDGMCSWWLKPCDYSSGPPATEG